jgi:RHS repeat-associated protein
VAVARTRPGERERIEAVFNGDNLLSSLVLATRHEHRDAERSATVRYVWTQDQHIPEVLTQRAEPRLDDAGYDRPGRLSADFAYAYGRTFATWEHGAAEFHIDAFGSALRTDDTVPWVQADDYDTFGAPEYEGERGEHAEPELPRFGYRGELALGPVLYLRARAYDASLGRFLARDPASFMPPRPGQRVNPYVYAGNDPVNLTDPLGQWPLPPFVSHFIHHVAHDFDAARHAVAHGFDDVRHTTAHHFDLARHAVASSLARHAIASSFDVARHDAAHVFDVTRDVVMHGLDVARHVVARIGHWIRKHNEVFARIGTFLSDVSGALALAGLVIAPIPGLDALTPVLEAGAAVASLGALASQGIAKAAGDRNITFTDLAFDALGAIPGGDAAEEGGDLLRFADTGDARRRRRAHPRLPGRGTREHQDYHRAEWRRHGQGRHRVVPELRRRDTRAGVAGAPGRAVRRGTEDQDVPRPLVLRRPAPGGSNPRTPGQAASR